MSIFPRKTATKDTPKETDILNTKDTQNQGAGILNAEGAKADDSNTAINTVESKDIILFKSTLDTVGSKVTELGIHFPLKREEFIVNGNTHFVLHSPLYGDLLINESCIDVAIDTFLALDMSYEASCFYYLTHSSFDETSKPEWLTTFEQAH